jgi:hypothetical protein
MNKTAIFVLFLLFTSAMLLLSACSGSDEQISLEENIGTSSDPTPAPELESLNDSTYPLAEMEFIAKIPENTPPDHAIYISVLDEVTGLALNATLHQMMLDEENSDISNRLYKVKIPFPVGSTVKYRYTRQANALVVGEHLANGQPVRYRLAQVDGPGVVSDIISRWTDTDFVGQVGKIVGRATNAKDQSPISNLLITAGGAQTISAEDGSFQIDGLPVGIHNLVGYAMDAKYETFYQGAEIAGNLPTLTPIELEPRSLVSVEFLVKIPEGTPPIIPLRLAGNLQQLGNTFSTLSGGVSLSASSLPEMQRQPDGLYKYSLQLPQGSDVRYKYTLGDGFWNAEHTFNGEFRIRQIIIPDHDLTVTDIIDTWFSTSEQSIAFDVTVPENTPPTDYVSIQFNPIFGWTEPLPMWPLEDNRWAYVLFSPLNLPGNFHYRYCRNDLCGISDDVDTPGDFGPGRLIDLNSLPANQSDSVNAWTDLVGQ